MRALPADWPDPADPDCTVPLVYLHIPDSQWPPSSLDSHQRILPAGWAECVTWSVDWDLVAPLMPGQVNSSPGFTAATATCTIRHPDGKVLAPWRLGDERTPKASKAELVASYDGPTGATAFTLGQFILDPIKGKMSERHISLTMVQDLVRLRKLHDLPTQIRNSFGSPAPFSPTRLIEAGAATNGFLVDASGDFDAVLDSSYFPGKTDELEAMQSIVSANLGAMFLSMDGTTIRVLDPDYLLGTGTVFETISVLDRLDDLAWAQDPNAAVDRIEVTFLPPEYDDSEFGPAPYDAAPIWTAPKGARLSPGQTKTWRFDPGSYIKPIFGERAVYGNSSKNGLSTTVDLPAEITMLSSGRWVISVTNNTGSAKYLVAPRVSGGFPGTDYSKGTRSVLVGTIDGASDQDAQVTLTWGKSAASATNTLTFNLGRNIQRQQDAQAILDRIVDRVSAPTYVLEDVRVVPNLGREIADLYRLQYPEVGFNTRAMVTGLKIAGAPGEIQQSLAMAVIPLTVDDFNDAWQTAFPGGATIADFNAVWAGKTIDDFNLDPLRTTP